jgi:pyruvate kinase
MDQPSPVLRMAIDQLDSIVAMSDAIMIARGDLGVELPAEQSGVNQSDAIFKPLIFINK